MSKSKSIDAWSVDEGLAAQYAAQAGLDPALAAMAGQKAWDVQKSLRDATSEPDPKRQEKLVRRTKARLAKAGLSGHRELVQHIEAKLMALQGRGDDTELAHLTPGEVVVPLPLQTPDVVQALQQAAQDLVHDFVYQTDGSLAPSQPGMRLYDADTFDISGDARYLGPQAPKDPPGLATNNGLPEEVVVTPNPDAETSLLDGLTGFESQEVIENWSNEKILRELNKIENFDIVANQGYMNSTARRGMLGTGIFFAGDTARLSEYASRLRSVCAQRGLDC